MKQTVSVGRGWAEVNGTRYEIPPGASVSVQNGVLFVNGKRWEKDAAKGPAAPQQ